MSLSAQGRLKKDDLKAGASTRTETAVRPFGFPTMMASRVARIDMQKTFLALVTCHVTSTSLTD